MAKTADDQRRVRLAVGSAPRHLLMAVLLEGAVIVGAAAVLGGAAILVSLDAAALASRVDVLNALRSE